MPIRLNLLAETQAAEEARRRDPVKRGIWVGGYAIFCMLLWVGWLQVDIFQAKSALKRQQDKWERDAPKFKQIQDAHRKAISMEGKLASLDRLSTNRFLWGSVLNALQTIQNSGLDQIQVTHLRMEQNYQSVEAVKSKTNVTATATNVVPAIPAAAVEKIALKIEARDWNWNDETYTKYKAALSNSEYFLKHLQRRDGFVQGTVSAPTADFTAQKYFVSFTLESRFPEVKRYE